MPIPISSDVDDRQCKLVATVSVFSDTEALLLRYATEPDRQGGWFVPNDLIPYAEHPDEAAATILLEHLDLRESPALHHIESFVGNDRSWHMVFHYLLRLDRRPSLLPGAMIKEARWFPWNALPSAAEVAHHGWSLSILEACRHEDAAGAPLKRI